MLLVIECALVLLGITVSFVSPKLGDRWFAPLEHRLSRLARKRRLSIVVVCCSALLIRLALLPVLPIPQPAVHDEFSYLLMGDTFAHGRLTNPTHPMWMHFETFHEIQKPTYASMYYPGQGLFLALGQVVFYNPYWGVWLSSALMCGAICWMLQAWVSSFWALIGGFLVVIRLGTVSYWANSYWGGAVAALGGALVLGALPRIKRRQRIRDAILMGVGFALLANSRPYEGIFFSIAILLLLLGWIRKSFASLKSIVIQNVVLPLGLIFLGTLVGMGYYFWRVTGSPFHTPFFVNVATYNPIPYFPWQSIKTSASYRHLEMEKFYLDWWMWIYQFGRHHPIVSLLLKVCEFVLFYLGPLLAIPVFFAVVFTLPYGISFGDLSPRCKFLILICGSVLLGAALPVYFNPHYVAAITCALYGLLMIAMQRLRRWAPFGKATGLAIVRAVGIVAVLMLILRCTISQDQINANQNLLTWYSPAIFQTPRCDVMKQLSAMPGPHLVIVRYAPDHPPIDEWVFNRADIDASRIVWAREMGTAQNFELLRYFHDRKAWLVEPDKTPPKLSPYTATYEGNR